MQQKTCATCFYDKGKDCEVLRAKVLENCFAWADEAEAKRREKAIKDYNEPILLTSMSAEQKENKRKNQEKNLMLRGGKSSFEVLDEHFLKLYEQGLSLTEIAKKLNVDRNRVYDYRLKKNIALPNKKADLRQQMRQN